MILFLLYSFNLRKKKKKFVDLTEFFYLQTRIQIKLRQNFLFIKKKIGLILQSQILVQTNVTYFN